MRGLLLVLPVLALPAAAQGQAVLREGQRVRITATRYHWTNQTGRIVSLTAGGDTLIVQFDRGRTINYRQVMAPDTVAVTAVERIDVSRAGGHRTGRGALIGLGIGAVVGFALGYSDYDNCSDCYKPVNSAQAEGFLGAAFFGVVGAGVGALVGRGIRWDTWDAVPQTRQGMLLQPLPQGSIGIGFTLRF